MSKYIYDGPVLRFGTCITSRWHGETYAVSERKARNNLIHQFKTKNNLMPGIKIDFPGKLLEVCGGAEIYG